MPSFVQTSQHGVLFSAHWSRVMWILFIIQVGTLLPSICLMLWKRQPNIKKKKNRTKLKTSSTRILICAGSSASALASCRLLAVFTTEWEAGAAFNGLRCSDQIHQTAEVKRGEQHAGEMCLKTAFTGTFSSRASGICMCKSSGPWPDLLRAIMKHIVELYYHQRAPCVDCD